MSAQPGPDGQELRARYYLRRLGARPLGHAPDPRGTPMEPEDPFDPDWLIDRRPPPLPRVPPEQPADGTAPTPVTPTRVIPAGAPLPARPPEPGETPPWRTPPPPPPPTVAAPLPAPHGPEPRIVEVRHVHEVLLTSPEPDPEPRPRLWERLWDRLCTWRMVVAILAAVVPWVNGQSPVGLWSHTVHLARTEAGIGAAYAVAGVAVAAAWGLDRHTGRAVPRALLVTASLGAFGVLHWWDPFLLLTGVTL